VKFGYFFVEFDNVNEVFNSCDLLISSRYGMMSFLSPLVIVFNFLFYSIILCNSSCCSLSSS